MIVLFCIFWVVAMAVCTYFAIAGAGCLLAGLVFRSMETALIGVIVFACAVTGLYHTAEANPFTVKIDTHIYQEHK
jgi:hypothetical protein